MSQTGSLHTDHFARALLAHRNSPCPISGLSAAPIVYGRVLRDFLPLQPGKFQPRLEWRQAAQDRANMYAKRHIQKAEQLSKGSKSLPPLQPGDSVSIQNQTGNNPRQWSQTGVVIEVGPHHSYTISVDGSRTITKRNRQFLRKITPFVTSGASSTGHQTQNPPPSILKWKTVDIPIKPLLGDLDPMAGHEQPLPADDTNQIVSPSNDNQPAQPEVAADSPPKSTKPNIPPHLCERWIVAKQPLQLSEEPNSQITLAPFQQ